MHRASNFYIVGIAFTVAIGGFLLGFDGSVISGAAPFYKSVFHIPDGSFLFGFSVSCIIWGSIIGNLVAGPLSDRIGRKPSLLVAAALFTATGLLCAFAGNIGIFILGRIVGGIAVGIAILIAPVYIAEISPAKKRGWLVSFNQLLIVIGLSAAYFSNYFILKAVHDPLINWRWMLGVEIVPAVLYFMVVLLIPESPRWLMMRQRDAQALAVLTKIGGEQYAQYESAGIRRSIASEEKISLRVQAKSFFSSAMKRVVIIGFGLAVLQQFSGINAILYYAPMVFESAGGGRDAAFVQAIALGVVFVVMTVVSMFLIDRLGRKPLLYTGVGIMAVSLTLVGFLFHHARYRITMQQVEALAGPDSGAALPLIKAKATAFAGKTYRSETGFYRAVDEAFRNTGIRTEAYKPALLKEAIHIRSNLVLLGILGFIAGFSISLGPIMWAMFSEIFPNRLRGFAISAVGSANAIASFLVATFFPVQLATLGSSATYFLYAGIMYFCLWFVWKYVVETKGRSLEQLEKELINYEDDRQSSTERL
jgi:sugar porter (SP) family MFS transporter